MSKPPHHLVRTRCGKMDLVTFLVIVGIVAVLSRWAWNTFQKVGDEPTDSIPIEDVR